MAAAQKPCMPSAICLQQSRSHSLCRRLTFVSTSALRARKALCLSSRPRPALILMHLPTANSEWASMDEIPKWSPRATKSFAMAETEARRMKYPKIGTESLLMGILTEGSSNAAKFLRANGVNLFTLREKLVQLLGKADYRYMTPRKGVPLTEPAQKALDWAVGEKIKSGKSGELTPTDIVLGIWAQKGSAGERVLAAFGIDDEKLKELESMGEEMGGGPKRFFSLSAISR
ncbi:hypothetical protein SUGI_0520490 [Cryptomeria japonica]|uniref:ATP-dependent Clp protease ATP-binding subunit CLPT1, chloroplastic n=1 Tax=Cryptomeria japonica TaxID=3369 RepID=UPI002408C5DF|nr:ATP-dependent Clp protease ATP-binding subunit CLPT1, chloroplastic [Cryptomeria japonica]GLJ26720.1 hypothetical protein SUGI_0520490 [Cryptomeria japonica]